MGSAVSNTARVPSATAPRSPSPTPDANVGAAKAIRAEASSPSSSEWQRLIATPPPPPAPTTSREVDDSKPHPLVDIGIGLHACHSEGNHQHAWANSASPAGELPASVAVSCRAEHVAGATSTSISGARPPLTPRTCRLSAGMPRLQFLLREQQQQAAKLLASSSSFFPTPPPSARSSTHSSAASPHTGSPQQVQQTMSGSLRRTSSVAVGAHNIPLPLFPLKGQSSLVIPAAGRPPPLTGVGRHRTPSPAPSSPNGATAPSFPSTGCALASSGVHSAGTPAAYVSVLPAQCSREEFPALYERLAASVRSAGNSNSNGNAAFLPRIDASCRAGS